MALPEGDLSAPLLEVLLNKLINEPDEVVASIASLFEIRDPNNSLEALRVAIKEGKMPILVANHQSLADGVVLSILTSRLGKKFNLQVAASIDEGQQGDLVRDVNTLIEPSLARRNLFTVPIATKRDIETRFMPGTLDRKGLSTLLHTADNGRGFAMFPEASVQGGRTNGVGEINGLMVEPNQRVFTRWVEKFAKQGYDAVVLPIGIDGSYKVFSPDTNSFSHEVMEMILGLADSRVIATVTLGDLIPFSEIGVGVQTDDFFMTRIAGLLPQPARGAYPLATP